MESVRSQIQLEAGDPRATRPASVGSRLGSERPETDTTKDPYAGAVKVHGSLCLPQVETCGSSYVGATRLPNAPQIPPFRVLLEHQRPARRRKRNRLQQQRPPQQPAQPAQPGAEPSDEAGNCSLTTKTSSLAHGGQMGRGPLAAPTIYSWQSGPAFDWTWTEPRRRRSTKLLIPVHGDPYASHIAWWQGVAWWRGVAVWRPAGAPGRA